MRSRPLSALALILFLTVTSANPVQAQSLVTSSPPAGAVLTSAPTQVSVTADGALAELGSSISLTDPDGSRADDGSVTVSDSTVLVGVKSLLKTGLYTVNYQLIFSDGQNLSGSYTFTLTGVTESPTPTTQTPSPTETFPPLKPSTFFDRLTSGGVGILLGALLLLVIITRVVSSRRNRK